MLLKKMDPQKIQNVFVGLTMITIYFIAILFALYFFSDRTVTLDERRIVTDETATATITDRTIGIGRVGLVEDASVSVKNEVTIRNAILEKEIQEQTTQSQPYLDFSESFNKTEPYVLSNVNGYHSLAVYIELSAGSATISVSADGINYVDIQCYDILNSAYINTVVSSGTYTSNISGMRFVKFTGSDNKSSSIMGRATIITADIENNLISGGAQANNPGTISSDNSATIALSSGQTWNGLYEDIHDFSMFSVLVILGNNENATLQLDFSIDSDGTTQRSKTVLVGTGASAVHMFAVISQYLRVSVIADQATAANGKIQTILHQTKSRALVSFINETISNTNDAQLVRAVVTGSTKGNVFKNVIVSSEGELATQYPATAFGEVRTAELSGVFAYNFVYNYINPNFIETFDALGGSVTQNNHMMELKTSTTQFSYGSARSRRNVHYENGKGSLFRFTCVFDTAIALTQQLAGPGIATDAFYIGYNGTNFGIVHQTDGVLEQRTLTVTTAATGAETANVTLNGASFYPVLSNAGGAQEFTAHEIASGATYTGWNVTHAANTVIFIAASVGAKNGTYAFSSNTATSVIAQNTAGAPLNNSGAGDWTYQSSFNVDTLDGNGPSGMTIDPQTGNVFEIQMQWLGFGAISFSVEEPVSGKFVPFHRLQYANSETKPSVQIPHLPVAFNVYNLGANTTTTLRTASMAGFIEGEQQINGPTFSVGASKSSVQSETVLITYKIRNSFHDLFNHNEIFVKGISVACEGTQPTTFRLILNPTSVGADTTADYTNYAYVNEDQSIVLSDSTADTYSGGVQLLSISLGKTEGRFIDLQSYRIIGIRDDILCVTAESSSSTTANAQLVWQEAQ